MRAIAVINPGNPTGAVLDASNVEMVLDFARRHSLSVLADEVYQENVYRPGDRFVSFASVLVRLGLTDVPLWSFHSVSKGYLGECGHRGGYLECRNVPADVHGRGGEAPVGGALRQLGGAARHLDHGPAAPAPATRRFPSSTGSGARCSTRCGGARRCWRRG